MIINDIIKEEQSDGVVVKSTVERHRKDRPAIEFYYKFSGVAPNEVDDSADPFAAACLIKSMRANEPLEINTPISHRLHVMLPRIRDIYHSWWPDLFKPIDIFTKPRTTRDPEPKDAMGTMFSGGVDSFYSLLKNYRNQSISDRPLTHIVFMRGVETPIERARGVENSEEWVKAVADKLGVRPIFGSTNVRTHIMTNWEKYDHGSALASIGLCLSPILGYMCIPSAFSYRHLVSHGSSPLTDEMFSTDRMYIFHDGSEVTRAEKVESIVKWNKDLSLRYLRVCLGNFGGAYNCGRCRKCVRTAIPLHVMGVAETSEIFQCKGTEHWKDLIAKDHLEMLRENYEFAVKHKGSQEIVEMLHTAIRQRRFDDAIEELRSISFQNTSASAV